MALFHILNKYGDEKQAIKWSEKLEQQYHDNKFSTHNPRTKVHLLIQELNKLIVQEG